MRLGLIDVVRQLQCDLKSHSEWESAVRYLRDRERQNDSLHSTHTHTHICTTI